MRAVRIHDLAGPKGLRLDEVPTPQPDEGELRIDVRAAGVNFPDVLLSYGKYQFKPEPPFVPGGEAAGVGCAVLGVFWGQFAMREPMRNRANLSQVLAWIAEGKLKPHVDAALPFARATEALERLERREVRGKLLLVP